VWSPMHVWLNCHSSLIIASCSSNILLIRCNSFLPFTTSIWQCFVFCYCTGLFLFLLTLTLKKEGLFLPTYCSYLHCISSWQSDSECDSTLLSVGVALCWPPQAFSLTLQQQTNNDPEQVTHLTVHPMQWSVHYIWPSSNYIHHQF